MIHKKIFQKIIKVFKKKIGQFKKLQKTSDA